MADRSVLASGEGQNTSMLTKTQIFKSIGGWGLATAPGLFMLNTILTGTTSAAIFGMTGAFIGAFVYGSAALPFLLSSCVGFTVGALSFYRASLAQALVAHKRYPALIQLHMDMNYPTRHLSYSEGGPVVNLRRNDRIMKSLILTSWLTAVPALEAIHTARETSMVEEYASRPESDNLARISEKEITTHMLGDKLVPMLE